MFKEIPEQEPFKEWEYHYWAYISFNRLINRMRRHKYWWFCVANINGNVQTTFSVAYDGKYLYSPMFKRDVTIREFKKHFKGTKWRYHYFSNFAY